MKLAETQAAFLEMCLAEQADVSSLAADGERARLLLYRDMVRWRFHQICGEVLPRTKSALGEGAFRDAVDHWVSNGRPRSRFFRDLPMLFADHLLARDLPALARDLLRLERARWHANIALDGSAPQPFALEAIPVPSPSLSVFETDHAVQIGGGDAPGRTRLAVYRRLDLEIETRWSSPTMHALIVGWAAGDRPAIDTVRAVLAAEGREPTPAFVEEMSALLSELVERGAILGSR